MIALATLQQQLDQLKTARASGATTINYEGKSVTYRSDEQMQAAIAALEAQINTATAATVARNVITRSHKGW